MDLDKDALDRHITGNYGEDQFPAKLTDCDLQGLLARKVEAACREFATDHGLSISHRPTPEGHWHRDYWSFRDGDGYVAVTVEIKDSQYQNQYR